MELIRKTLSRFARYLSRELKDSNVSAKTITLKIRLKPFSTHTHQRTLEKSTSSSKEILEEALRLLEEMEIDLSVRLVGLRMSGLEKMKK